MTRNGEQGGTIALSRLSAARGFQRTQPALWALPSFIFSMLGNVAQPSAAETALSTRGGKTVLALHGLQTGACVPGASMGGHHSRAHTFELSVLGLQGPTLKGAVHIAGVLRV